MPAPDETPQVPEPAPDAAPQAPTPDAAPPPTVVDAEIVVAEEPDAQLARPAALPRDRNPFLVYIGSLSPGSRHTMTHALNTIARLIAPESDAEHFPWWRLGYQHTQRVRSLLAERYAPANVNKMLTALRRVLVECRRLELMTVEQCARACDLRPARGSRVRKGRALDRGEIASLHAACGSRAIGLRNAAVLALLAGGGFRRSELVGLDAERFDLVRAQATVVGKGNKERVVPLPEKSVAALRRWLEHRPKGPGPLFYPMTKSGGVLKRRMSSQNVLAILAGVGSRAGVEAFSPHDLRRTFITSLLDAGADIGAVADVVGHESVDTTRKYDKRGERAARAAVSLLDLPFEGGVASGE
jgi:integrase